MAHTTQELTFDYLCPEFRFAMQPDSCNRVPLGLWVNVIEFKVVKIATQCAATTESFESFGLPPAIPVAHVLAHVGVTFRPAFLGAWHISILLAKTILVDSVGDDPTTCRLRIECSTN